MSASKVSDLMVAIDEYATVSEDATLRDAILALEAAQTAFEDSPRRTSHHHHRAVLVVDDHGRPVGKVSHWVLLRAIEPRYATLRDPGTYGRFGLTGSYARSLMETHELWRTSLNELCGRAASARVKDVMYSPEEGEFITEDAPIEEAIHQLVMGHHQSLLVMRGSAVVGELRVSDVFFEVTRRLKDCGG